MEYTVVGDLHCKPSNLNKVENLFNLVESLNNNVIMLGDTLDTKEIIHGKCLNLVYDKLINSNLNWIFLIGNHCRFNKYDSEHSLRVLESLPNVTIVSSPVTLDDIDFIPYTNNSNIINHIEQSNAKLGFGHVDIQGFDYGNGVLSKEGLTAETFSKYDLFISGHYHKYQNKQNIIYLGTPFSHSFGESNQTKVVMKINTETLQTEIIPTNFAQHYTITHDCDVTNSIYAYKDEIDPKNHYRIILTGKQENIDKVNKDILPEVKFIEKPIIETKGLIIDETLDHHSQFEKWAKEKELDETTLKKGLEVLNNVS